MVVKTFQSYIESFTYALQVLKIWIEYNVCIIHFHWYVRRFEQRLSYRQTVKKNVYHAIGLLDFFQKEGNYSYQRPLIARGRKLP